MIDEVTVEVVVAMVETTDVVYETFVSSAHYVAMFVRKQRNLRQ